MFLARIRLVAVLALAIFAVCGRPQPASAQYVNVTSGSYQSNVTSGTIDSLTVTGTGPTGTPSTYAADAPLTVRFGFDISDSGVFDVNADVTVTTSLYYAGNVYGGGILNLNSGTLAVAGQLNVSGSGSSITRTAGAYSLGGLSLSDGASLDYLPADSLSGSVYVSGGSRLTLERDLDLSGSSSNGYLNLSGTDALVRNGYSYAVYDLSLSGTASLAYTGSDAITGSVDVSDGASLILDKNLSVSQSLSLAGTAALVRNGHDWSTDSLSLAEGADLTYGAGDSVGLNVNIVGIETPTSLTLDKDLLLTGNLQFLGSGAAIVRNGHSFAAGSLNVTNGAALTFTGDDDVATGVYVADGGQLALDRNLVLSSTSAFRSITVTGSSSSLVTGTFNYAADQLSLSNGPSLAYRPGDSITTNVFVDDGSTLTLERDLSVTNTLWLTGSGALVTGTHAYAAANLTLGNGASLDYRPGDEVTANAYVWNGSTLTLQRNLSLTNSLYLSGSGALVTGTFSYAAPSLTLQNGASLDYRPGDEVTESVAVSNGSTLTLERNLSLTGHLGLSGSGALVRTTQTIAANTLSLADGATFEKQAGDAIASSIDVYDGSSLTLLSPLALAADLTLSGSGSFVTNENTYSVRGLNLQGGATAGFGSGDSISQYLTLSGSGSGLLATSPLALSSLSISAGGLLTLSNSFSGTGGPGAWALSVAGDERTTLNDYLGQNLIAVIGGGAGSPTTVYDAGLNRTYLIMSVPEPATLALAVCGLAATLGARARRRRRGPGSGSAPEVVVPPGHDCE